ncbi:MAG TPA: ABC transporter ATP-binding protein, partial [Caulobacteraceae bacterium]
MSSGLTDKAPSGAEFAVDVSGLRKTFGGKAAVDGVALKLERGQICGFLGPNGSGKTTTLRMLCGLLTPDAGEGRCLGFDIRRESDEIKRRTGYMTQAFSLYQDLTIEENLNFIAGVYGLDRRKQRVEAALTDLGLFDRRGQLAGALSGGWKQRLALAGATLHEPALLLLDEPTAGVDPRARRTFWDQIHRLAGRGLTVLVSTHYMDEAERCDEIAYILSGRLLARGTTEGVIRDAKLTTFVGEGARVSDLADEIARRPGVESAAPFGPALHVAGPDRAALEAALAPYRRAPFSW